MRIVFLLLSLSCLAAGIVFGALNPASVTVDFYWLQVPVSLGFALLAAALVGALLAGFVLSSSVIWPLRARLRRARRQQAGALPPEAVQDVPVAAPDWTVSRTP